MSVTTKFPTPREMANRLGVSVHKVLPILESLEDISPQGFADSTPVYDQTTTTRVRYELNLLKAKETQNDE